MIYKNEWLAHDANIHSHSGIRQEEELHNLVRFERGGRTIPMREGASPSRLLALQDSARFAYLAVDVTPIYGANSDVLRSEREIVFLKPNTVVVFDRLQSTAETTRHWQLNSPIRPTRQGATWTITGGTSSLAVHRVLPTDATESIIGWAATDGDMGGGFRLDVEHRSTDGGSRFLHVLSLDGSVTSSSAFHSSDLGGVRMVLSDGTQSTVQFRNSQPGGSLEIRDAQGVVLESLTLEPAISVLPLFARN